MPDHISTLDFWRSIEIFEPQTIPKLTSRKIDEPVITARTNELLPWQAVAPPKQFTSKGKEIKTHYQVYCGVFKIKRLKEIFERIFDDVQED